MDLRNTKFYSGLDEKKAIGIINGVRIRRCKEITEVNRLTAFQWLIDNGKVGKFSQIVENLINNGLLQKTNHEDCV